MTNSNMTVARAADKLRESEYAVAVTDFMTPAEIAEVYDNLTTRSGGTAGCFFWGGCRGAERCAAVFLPEWYLPEPDAPLHSLPLDRARRDAFARHLCENPNILSEIPIRALRICGSGFCSLTHRDFMGGILSLGIERSTVGDIAVLSENEALVFVLDKVKSYIMTELTRIGRDSVRVTETEISPDYEIPRRYESTEITVASARLDGVVRAITGKSRESAADMIRSGLVELRYIATDNISAEVKNGDILSVRGFGKYEIGETDGQTRSGRIKIKCRKYI